MKNYDEFVKHVLDCYPQEACGVVKEDIFYPLENIHSNPADNFLIDEHITYSLLGKKYKILHSHTMETYVDDPRTPSYEDMLGQRNTQVPWGIVHCDGENVTDILWLEDETITELEGRTYIHNVYDCFTLARDWYRLNRNIDFGTHPRPADWQRWNPHYIEQNYEKLGFVPSIAHAEGDILLFSIEACYPNHIGVYLGNGEFLHHLHGRKSRKDNISKWKRQLVKVLKYDKK